MSRRRRWDLFGCLSLDASLLHFCTASALVSAFPLTVISERQRVRVVCLDSFRCNNDITTNLNTIREGCNVCSGGDDSRSIFLWFVEMPVRFSLVRPHILRLQPTPTTDPPATLSSQHGLTHERGLSLHVHCSQRPGTPNMRQLIEAIDLLVDQTELTVPAILTFDIPHATCFPTSRN
jgi:hypothetical protein